MFRIIFLLAVVTHAFAIEGNSCRLSRVKNDIGVCQTLENCRHLKGQQISCGFQNGEIIVCCPRIETTTPSENTTTAAILYPTKEHRKRISTQKCREYAKAVYEKIEYEREGGRQIIKLDKCAQNAGPLIGGEENATTGEFPHMAVLGYEGNGITLWLCAGSLISEDYVITAAYCTNSRRRGFALTKVRLGGVHYFKTSETTHTEDVRIAEIINHPLYSDKYYYNNIALIRLNRRVNMSPFIRPACLPTEFQTPNTSAIAISAIKFAQLTGFVQKIAFNILEHSECASFYEGPDINNTDRYNDGIRQTEQFCAKSVNPELAVCESVSLQVRRESDYCTYTIIGVLSFGVICQLPGFPDVYTSVYNYLDWIENIVWS